MGVFGSWTSLSGSFWAILAISPYNPFDTYAIANNSFLRKSIGKDNYHGWDVGSSDFSVPSIYPWIQLYPNNYTIDASIAIVENFANQDLSSIPCLFFLLYIVLYS